MDYAQLANQYGGTSAEGQVADYESLAKQFGGISQTPEQRQKLAGEMTHTPHEPTPFSVGEMITGEQRKEGIANIEGQQIKTGDLPEFDLPFELKTRQIKTAAGLLTTSDPQRQVNILKENYPKLKFYEDNKGNVIVNGSEYGGKLGVLNMPGISPRDLLKAGFDVALYTGAAMTGGGMGALPGAATVGAASGAAAAGEDIASQMVGGTEEVSLKNISIPDVLLASVGGAGAELFARGIAKIIPAMRQTVKTQGITDEVRQSFKQEAIRLGIDPNEITDDVIKGFTTEAKQAVTPGATGAMQGEREFGIGLTKGQRTGTQKQLVFEDRARSGDFGQKAQEIILNKESQAGREARAAAQRVQSELGGEVIERPAQAGGAAAQGIRTAEQTEDATVKEAFNKVGEASLEGPYFVRLLKTVKDSVSSTEFIKSPKLAPASSELLGDINKFLKIAESGAEIRPQQLNQLNQIRKTIGSYIDSAANPADRRTLTTIKRSFDESLDNAVMNSLFKGDQAALSTLKKANVISREYFRKFTAQPIRTRSGKIADKPGKFIENIIEANPTDEQIVNTIFGANNLSNKAGALMADKFRTILGQGSDEWNQIRQAGFLRLLKTLPDGAISGPQSLNSLNKTMVENRSLMNELYTPQEIGTFRRLFMQIKRTQPQIVKSRQNPSGTASAITANARELMRKSGEVLGIATGNPLLIISSKGYEVGSGLRSTARIKEAVRPFAPILAAKPIITGIGTTATLKAPYPIMTDVNPEVQNVSNQ